MAILMAFLGHFSGLIETAGILVAAIVVVVAINVLLQLIPSSHNSPPVVFHYFPFLGSTVSYGMNPYVFFNNCQNKYGDVFTFILLGKKITVTLGAHGNDFVFNAKLSDVSAEEAYTHLTTPVFGKDVVYDVPNHILIEQKKFVKFGLTTETFRSYVPLIESEVLDYVSRSACFSGASGIADCMQIGPEITIFTASRTLQGKEVRGKFDSSFAQLYHDLDKGFTPINFLAPWLPLPNNRKRDIAQRKMAQVYMDIIVQRRKDNHSTEYDMIENLMDQTYKDGRKLNDREIAHIMIALLMAGQHTSAATSAWALLRLGSKPDIIEAMYKEQRDVLGDAPLTYERLGDLKLLNAVIKETLRLHPPIHSIMRKVKKEIPVRDTNYVVPRGHYVMAAPGVSAVDVQHFPNPYEYDPYRWFKSNAFDESKLEKMDYGFGAISKGGNSPYLPFGAGRHRCIGESFAQVQLGTILSTFVREFQWTLPPGHTKVPNVDYTCMVALPESPCNIHWKKRAA